MEKHFRRPDYAAEIAQQLLGQSMFATDTLFLGAPRRTGKSTFLTGDLTPAMEAAGAHVLYVDLWKDKEKNPADLIAFTIANNLATLQGAIARAAGAVGLSKVSIHGVEFSLDAVGKKPGASIADALQELQAKAAKPVVFIVDEAQHAIKSKESMSVMFSLKSARDTINAPGVRNLVLVMSGSDRDKLLRLVHGNAAPFLGSRIHELPLLDKAYTDFVAGFMAIEKPAYRINTERFFQSFVKFNHRPEFFLEAINDLTSLFGPAKPDTFHDLLDEKAAEYEAELAAGYAAAYEGLTKMQRAVLTRVLSSGRNGKLYDADALAEYSKAHGKRVDAGAARSAVEKLRELDPPLIWKSARGEYAPEDSGMRSWYEKLHREGRWPPVK